MIPSLVGVEEQGPPYGRAGVKAVVAACADLDDVVLMGHSGAGLLLPAVAEAIPGQVEGIVFVEAALPPPRW